ncbi:peroxiredoxin [Methylomonas paludis]|uniref:thioredoxin-dependent peroxiredoxin n=1 Tax=Methylomonas paludis TaxID=1173101 RepID=A0A975MP68_9GAMM|nr:peroxiredoxin [Methylomonas paludis]QWF71412.1 peroxiredoxin [Methylomonas paludis]
MSELILGKPVPDFQIAATDGKTIQLSDYRGKKIVLYFYPKDSTPGCTLEGVSFKDHFQQFQGLQTVILGVSRDSSKSHDNFKSKQGFPFDLLADTDETLCQLFDVIKMKSMYGKQVRGIERSTFIIDESGVLLKEWRKVQVKTHVTEVLAFLQGLA